MAEQATRAGGSAAEWDIPSVPIEQAAELFVTLQKALRAFQLYDENNPVYQRFVGNLRGAFRELWGEAEDLRAQVEEFKITWYDEVVYENDSRSESLAFLFYKDGIREIQFLPGIEDSDLEALLRVLQRARNLRPEGDDLLTILWDEDLTNFQYRYVDLLAEGVDVPEAGGVQPDVQTAWAAEMGGGTEEEEAPGRRTMMQEAEAADEPPKAKVSSDDFNPTLYSLDPREVEQLQKELVAEMERDVRRDVLHALFDRIESDGAERQREVLDIFRTLLPNLLSHGALSAAGEILDELHGLPERAESLIEEERLAAAQLLDEISASDAVEELVVALQSGTITPSPVELGGFLKQLRPAALASLVKASQHTDDKRIQSVLLDAVAQIGAQSQQAIVNLFRSQDPDILAGACQLAGRMGLTQAGATLGKLMGHAVPAVRLSAVEASVALKASTAATGLEQALDDDERDIRIAAAKGLAELRFQPSAAKVKTALGSRRMKHADISEKIAFFEAYGAVGGEEAVTVLGRLLNRKGLLGRREPEEIRACAALGLGRAGSANAMSELRAAQNTAEPVVRSAVSRALRKEQES